ncbi:MAG: glycosyltransferase family 4 protein, partial [Sedimenticolaceae bacterium]
DIYGAYPPPRATQLNNAGQGFHIRGWADDAHQVMRRARVCLAPLRFGAGLKGKLVDAMSCGTPNVTTSVGAEAMHAELPWSGAIADDPEVFARLAVGLYQSKDQWQQARKNGATIINTLYDAVELGERLLQRINHLRGYLAAHRLDNFTGAMLQHHTQQSTRYMAQWIEAKNRGNPNKV